MWKLITRMPDYDGQMPTLSHETGELKSISNIGTYQFSLFTLENGLAILQYNMIDISSI